jgi:tRNA (cytidine32/uridine32-2'-O)-methyltransferase
MQSVEYPALVDKLDFRRFGVDIPVRIVLVGTTHPGNIGAAARAMKTMGLHELVLVAPKRFPDPEASARASGADDVLERARIVETLPDAIADCGFVAASTARLRGMRWPVEDPRHAAASIWRAVPQAPAAVVFGPEHSGLTNDDLARCNLLIHIPTHPDYGSLNLAMAVQVICYELRMAQSELRIQADEQRDERPATASELEGFYLELERLLTDARFLHPDHPHQLKLKLRRLFARAELDANEINILRGALSALDPERRAKRADYGS